MDPGSSDQGKGDSGTSGDSTLGAGSTKTHNKGFNIPPGPNFGNPNYLNLMHCDDKELLAKINNMQMERMNTGSTYSNPQYQTTKDSMNTNISMLAEDSDEEDITTSYPPGPPNPPGSYEPAGVNIPAGNRFISLNEIIQHKKLVVVSREEWGAVPPLYTTPMKYPLQNIIINFKSHARPCYTKEDCMERMRDLQKYHMEVERLSDIPYNFMVGHDGTIYEGRGWKAQPSASLKGLPEHGRETRLEFAYFGDYRRVIYPVQTMNAIMDLVKEQGMDEGLVNTFCDFDDYRENLPPSWEG